MKLDSRIKALSDILTCFDTERAEQFIGQKGYFADYHCAFTDLSDRDVGLLTEIRDHDYSFHKDENGGYFWLFLPESCLKPKEKKFRPFTLEEFKDKFTIGRPIKFRKKDDFGNERYLILNGYVKVQLHDGTGHFVHIGSTPYTLDELFNEYEWQSHYTEDYQPFGVEE